MAKNGLGAGVLLLVLAGILGCSSKSVSERASIDQEIARNILWRFHQDSSNRFRDVRVTCENRVITLEGRVSDSQTATDAIQISLNESRGGKVDSRLEIRFR
ncbi:MAG TPA: BON domain-containing protein [Planctomycetota bacterium]|nr:BON domain-containing protein [Planctomycetota bacterium]